MSKQKLTPRVGMRVYWRDPDAGLCSGWGIVTAIHGDIISVQKDDGGEVDAPKRELFPATGTE